jgi:hypothetical protein
VPSTLSLFFRWTRDDFVASYISENCDLTPVFVLPAIVAAGKLGSDHSFR